MPLSVGVGCMHMVFTTKGIVSLAGLGAGDIEWECKKAADGCFF